MTAVADLEAQLRDLRRDAVDLVSEAELRERLKEGRPLRVKLGIDPTSRDIHIGHTMVLRKLRQFQDHGHQAVLIIGDYTAMVGDPTGRNKTRPQLGREDVEAYAASWLDQVRPILDVERAEIRRNGEWFSKMAFLEVIRLASKMTVARLLERDDFLKRYRAGEPISVHEFLYPLMQGYDSVMVRADVELGGTDQLFNLMVGRDFLREAGMKPQVCLTTPLVEGLDGVQKMSKSLGNHIAVADPPDEVFGKTMSISDPLMARYYRYFTDVPEAELPAFLARFANPRDAKVHLARELVRWLHGEAAAAAAAGRFEQLFSRRELPEDLAEVTIAAAELRDGKVWPVRLVVLCGFASTNGEARRLIREGAVTLDGDRIADETDRAVPDGAVLRVGKRRIARLRHEGKPGLQS